MKKRIQKSLLCFTLTVLGVSTLAILSLCFCVLGNTEPFRMVLFVSLGFDILIAILVLAFARKISQNIVKPIMTIDLNRNNEKAYEELKPFLNRIKAQNRESELSLQIRREFSANVSHELKTPLTTILGYSQILNNSLAKPEDICEIAGKIEKESTRLLNLINDIIKLSHLEEEGSVAERDNVDIFEITKDVVSALSPSAHDRNVSIETNGVETVVSGNKTQIRELISNLVENAIKYNREGGSVLITVCNSSISVADTGIGIAPEYKERIFERFFRVDKSRSKKVNGTGLGLSIVKHIAIMHNAKISVESEPGKGTEITVDFNLPA